MMLKPLFAAALAGLLFVAPATAQAVFPTVSSADMVGLIADVEGEITETGNDDEGEFFLYVTDKSELNYEVHGAVCEDKAGVQHCSGLQLSAWFELQSQDDVDEAIAMIDYVALADDDWGDNVFALTRYLILDGGVTRENLKVNLEVFLDISNDVWDLLSEEGFFE